MSACRESAAFHVCVIKIKYFATLFTELESKMWQALFSSTFSNGVERYMVQLLDNNNAIKCTGIFYNRNHFVTGQKCFSEWLTNRGGIIYVPNYPDIDHRTQQINRIKSTFVDIEVNIGNGQESIGSVLIVQVSIFA